MVAEKIGRNFIRYTTELKSESEGVEKMLLCADVHWDNPDCNRALFEKHLKQAKQGGHKVAIIGDFFCAMQGKYDKRSDKSKVRPEHQNSRYLDSLVTTAAEWLMPYRDCILMISPGNHETSIMSRHETDLIERLIEHLNQGFDKPTDWVVLSGGYGGYIKCRFRYKNTDDPKHVATKLIKYYHGHGGGGPVTKGTIQSQRQAVYFPDADVVVSGHVHESYIVSQMQERISNEGVQSQREQLHIRTPTYKDEYKDGGSGWHVETGKPPKPLGAWWLMFELFRDENRTYKINLNVSMAR